MSATTSGHINDLNIGIISARRPARRLGRNDDKKTIIVTGVARSGTSFVASVLRAAGLYMGEFIYDVVNEDAQMLEIVRSRDAVLLRTLIEQRNRKHGCWGFKIPNLHTYLRQDELSVFRNPHLIVIYRDPVAVAVRNAISEHYAELDGGVAAAGAMQALGQFVQLAECPLLLLSYEKALAFPNLMIDSILDFCGISLDDAGRAALVPQMQPKSRAYLTDATRRYHGRIDRILDGALFGWCFQEGRLEPVKLDLLADGQLIATFDADAHRGDLAAGGIGNGYHGFNVNLTRYRLRGSAVIRVRINGRVLELENSGQRLDRLDEKTAPS